MDNISKTDKEVDLRIIYNKIVQIFSSLWNTFIKLCLFIRKKIVFLFVFSILGAALGVGLTFVSKPTYISTLTVSSTTLNNQYCFDMINTLNLLIKDKVPELLAQELKIEIGSAKEIQKIEFLNYNNKVPKIFDDKDTVALVKPFKIKAYVSSPSVFDTLQKALVNYLENNEYALKRKEIKKENIKLMQKKLIGDIRQLDSLKLVIASNLSPRGTSNGFVFGQPIDPINIFKEGINLFQDNLNLNSSLILSENIQVIQYFTPRKKPDSPKLFTNIVIYGAGTFILGLIMALYKENGKKDIPV